MNHKDFCCFGIFSDVLPSKIPFIIMSQASCLSLVDKFGKRYEIFSDVYIVRFTSFLTVFCSKWFIVISSTFRLYNFAHIFTSIIIFAAGSSIYLHALHLCHALCVYILLQVCLMPSTM